MGSAIGNYIHLTAREYKQHGTYYFFNEKTNYNNVPKIFNSQRRILRKLLENKQSNITKNFTPQEQKKFSDALSLLMRPTEEQSEKINELWEEFTKYLREEFLITSDQIERACGNIYKNNVSEHSSYLKKIEQKGKEDSKIKLSTILQRIKIIEKIIEQINKTSELDFLIDQINNIYKQLSEISKIKQETLRETGYDFSKKAKGLQLSSELNSETIMLIENECGGVINAINEIIGKVKMTENLRKGSFFQGLIGIAALFCEGRTSETVTQYLKEETIKGLDRSSVKIDTTKFSKSIDFTQVLKEGYVLKDNSSIYQTIRGTQDKIDVIIKMQDKNPIRISAKNVNFKAKADIHLVEGASLLSMIANLPGDYVNHVLNVLAQHDFSEDTQTIDQSIINSAHQSLEEILLLQAFEGYKTGAKKADFFIINDNSTGSVKIYSIPALVLKLKDNINDKVNNFIKINVNGNTDINDIRFENAFNASGWEGRITQLISHVHSQKVSVSISKDSLPII